MEEQPRPELAEQVLPAPLYAALKHLFAQGIRGSMLVGGTALAGYYAGHRRSDDIDIFTRDEQAQRAAAMALRSLVRLGATVEVDQSTPQFSSFGVALSGHHFTAQSALDPQLFAVGKAHVAGDGVCVACVDTLLKQKAATLVSRASEKDLYDLAWLFERRPQLDLEVLVELGREIDRGVSAETMLIVLAGTALREDACGFALGEAAKDAYRTVADLKQELMRGLDRMAQREPAPKLAELVRALK